MPAPEGGGGVHMYSPGGDTEECANWDIYSRSAVNLMATKASSLRKHAEQSVFAEPILNSRPWGSVLPYVMKMIMDIQHVLLSTSALSTFRL